MPREWFHFAHICDTLSQIPDSREEIIHIMRKARLFCGEGGIDIEAILNRLPEIPYSIELPHLERAKELGYAEHACRCLKTAQEYLAAHPRE